MKQVVVESVHEHKKRRQFIYLANHGHACLHLPRIEVRVKELDCHQLRDLVLSTEDIDQPIQLHHAKVLTSLHTSHHFDLNTSVVIRSKDIIGGLEIFFYIITSITVRMVVNPFSTKNESSYSESSELLLFLRN